MDGENRAQSEDNLCFDSDDAESNSNIKVKVKRPSVLGKLKNRLFGHKKRRTRSHDSTTTDGDSQDECVGSSNKAMSTNQLAADSSKQLGDTTFPPAEDLTLPQTGMVGMKNGSASLEALGSSSKLKSELERKLVNRRSLDDDGLPGSPMGTPTGDIMSHSGFMSQDYHRSDRDSDGSLLSIGSSENEEDAFFKNPWKGAYTSAIRRPRHRTLSSDSEPEDNLDFDAVTKTENLSNSAAMHKRNVRPRHRNKTRRVTAATGQMPSLAEKKTLEIAHTFLHEGETPSVKLRGLDTAMPLATVRRTDSGRAYSSPAAQRKSDPNVISSSSKSPKPVTRSSTTAAHISNRTQHSEEHQAHGEELMSVLQRRKSQTATSSNEPTQAAVAETAPSDPKVTGTVTLSGDTAAEDDNQPAKAPPRPVKTVGFTGSPPLQRRSKAPAVQPRPKSMFPQHMRSKTQEIQGSNVDEALNSLSYSKSFNNHETHKLGDELLKSKPSADNDDDKSLPEWAKLAKRKTWAIPSTNEEAATSCTETSGLTSNPAPSKPVAAPRAKLNNYSAFKPDQLTDMSTELQNRFSHVGLRAEPVPPDTHASRDAPKSTYVLDVSDDSRVEPIASQKGPVMSASSRSPYDNMLLGNRTEETKINKKPAVVTKPYLSPNNMSGGDEATTQVAQPPWKASLKLRTGSLKSTPATRENESLLSLPITQDKPSWKSATMKERSTASLMSTSTDGQDGTSAAMVKSQTLENPPRKPNRMTMSETSAYTNESPEKETGATEEPRSFKDRLKMFQSQ